MAYIGFALSVLGIIAVTVFNRPDMLPVNIGLAIMWGALILKRRSA